MQVNSRSVIVFSTVKAGMMAYEQSKLGYTNGQVNVDFTYKICKEKTPLFTCSVQVYPVVTVCIAWIASYHCWAFSHQGPHLIEWHITD